ncbi:MAG: M24 family metallopeptidase [Halobacteriaceae archaeon]
MQTKLPETEFANRLTDIRDRINGTEHDAGVWFNAISIEYLTGFNHIQTERPVVLAITPDTIAITVPRLEVERVQQNSRIDTVYSYFDYPQGNPIETATSMLDDLEVTSVAADMDGAPGVSGYEGPDLSEFVDTLETYDWVSQMRRAKSPAEINLIRESARWANLAHRYLADLTNVGAHPATVSQRASLQGSRAMLDTLGSEYVPRTRGDGPVHAGYITGEQTRLPHGHTANRRLKQGDVVITGASANIDGYYSELERTMFVGSPTDEQTHYFEQMLEAQTIAIDALGPGVELSAVDEAVWEYFEEQGITDLAQHHVGHNIGMEGHEPPYIDKGAEGTMKPGHVYTIEPGIYTDTYGYRHSDTVAITEEGIDRLTYFPRQLEENIISIE